MKRALIVLVLCLAATLPASAWTICPGSRSICFQGCQATQGRCEDHCHRPMAGGGEFIDSQCYADCYDNFQACNSECDTEYSCFGAQ